MEFDFRFVENNKKLLEMNMKIKGDMKNTRGAACKYYNLAFVNLSARQWKECCIDEELLIEELTKTIIHEFLHLVLNTKFSGEEKICQTLAGQIKEQGLESIKNETFI